MCGGVFVLLEWNGLAWLKKLIRWRKIYWNLILKFNLTGKLRVAIFVLCFDIKENLILWSSGRLKRPKKFLFDPNWLENHQFTSFYQISRKVKSKFSFTIVKNDDPCSHKMNCVSNFMLTIIIIAPHLLFNNLTSLTSASLFC